ncbi:hypothetical protein ABB37_08945 [Leptomonas pyrrhocoris]|uniref:Uncharacterized protein n=1 Tax=Leptomonas pyrrhocoris TaxID=157538 RepID=A0A0M9FS75_LEPPY|nr:hypothetical protein ABB37_08945 [Leptomonas pyrrhocoris]KPA74985.1 hypothetical protein ABB37_08945 [Leptomonas pyrrhocoris]|eukprot:XP_015653424.1 hypothetical protein ABB37_08945 [Leptomonas pyrrhocoris]
MQDTCGCADVNHRVDIFQPGYTQPLLCVGWFTALASFNSSQQRKKSIFVTRRTAQYSKHSMCPTMGLWRITAIWLAHNSWRSLLSVNAGCVT